MATETYCSSAPMTRDRHDGGPGLDREAHEAEPELGQLVALVERLRDAARALGEDEQRLALLEQTLGVLGHAHDLADAREQRATTKGRLSAHFSTIARTMRGGSASMNMAAPIIAPSMGTCPEWLATSRTRPGARARCRGPRCGNSGGGAGRRVARAYFAHSRIEAERVDAAAAERHGHAREALARRPSPRSRSRVSSSRLLGRAEDTPEQARRPADGGVEAREGSGGAVSHGDAIIVAARPAFNGVMLRSRAPGAAPAATRRGIWWPSSRPPARFPREELLTGPRVAPDALPTAHRRPGSSSAHGYLAGSDARRGAELARRDARPTR